MLLYMLILLPLCGGTGGGGDSSLTFDLRGMGGELDSSCCCGGFGGGRLLERFITGLGERLVSFAVGTSRSFDLGGRGGGDGD